MKTYKKYKKGGKPIDSGSYGCVFKPALKCKHKTRKNGVSKLMLEKHANNELQLLEPMHKLLQKHPDIKKYILIPTKQDICIPDKLTSSDLKNFDNVCRRLHSNGYSILSINNNLESLRLLLMEDGGITLYEYIQQLTNKHVYSVLKGLYNIYNRVIITINHNGYFHTDIKDNNILVKSNSLKLIDFGLMIQHDTTTINPRFLQHSLHHLTPFSVLLFHDGIPFHWNKFYKQYHSLPKESFIEECAQHIKNMFLLFKRKNTESSREKYGQEHIKDICGLLFPNQDYLYVISKDLAYCYYYFKTQNGMFDMLNYYNTVFIYLTDIWGLCSILITLLDRLIFIRYNHLFIESIKKLVKKYMFGMQHYPIDLQQTFVKDLKQLTNAFNNSYSKKSSSKKSSSKKSSSKKSSSKKSSSK